MEAVRGVLMNIVQSLGMGQPARSDNSPLRPTYADVCVIRAMLRTLNLPTELVLEILDYAQYWPSRTISMARECSVASAFRSPTPGKICLDVDVISDAITKNFGDDPVKVKEIEFEITSHDQGWTSEGTKGTYITSSWLEVSILRRSHPDAPPLGDLTLKDYGNSATLHDTLAGQGWEAVERPPAAEHYPQDDNDKYAWFLQGNKVAASRSSTHKVVWSTYEDEFNFNEGAGNGVGFLNEVRAGDRVVVWTRAKWTGWACHVANLKMTIRYGV